MRIELSHVVKDKREKVFNAFTDLEKMPTWSKTAKSVKVISRKGNTVKREEEIEAFGRKAKITWTSVLTPPEKIAEDGMSDDGSIIKGTYTFTEVPEGTRIDIVNDMELKGVWMKLLGPLAKRQMRNLLKKEFQSFARYVEST